MNKLLRSLRNRLFLWYIGSLLILTVFFFLVVHILALPYGIDIFFIIFLILTIIGFFIIYKITSSLTYLSSRIDMITRENLEDRILDIKGNDEIAELAQTFNRLLDRMNKAFKREQQFIADVAHEMKTPLATLRSSFEVALSRKRSDDEYRQVLEEAIVETDRLSLTLKNVLDLAWSEAPDEQKKETKFNLSELMNDLYDIAQKMALKKEITVKASLEENIIFSGFEDRLARAILNIIDNAIKYTKHKGQIDITLEKLQNIAFITIEDNGQGINQSEIPHIFNRFYRGSKTDKVFGAGLGLAISKSIILLHHGDIKVESEVGRGTKFVISLNIC